MNATIRNLAGELVVLKCCTPEQVREWGVFARRSGARLCMEHFCADCTTGFRARHHRAGTCAAAVKAAEAVE